LTDLAEINHHGARLAVEIDDKSRARLRINGLVRDETGPPAPGATLRLTSSVQTGYEWHEFIEAVVEYRSDGIIVTLLANGVELVTRRFTGSVQA